MSDTVPLRVDSNSQSFQQSEVGLRPDSNLEPKHHVSLSSHHYLNNNNNIS